jgi:hypothetical protein
MMPKSLSLTLLAECCFNAGLGCHLSRNIYSELTWRSYYVDYDNDGLFYRTFTYCVELTTGVSF